LQQSGEKDVVFVTETQNPANATPE
jgi:hypothetical protein